MSAIGILGGMGHQASAKLYELLIKGTRAYTPAALDDDYPEIVLLNVPVPNFISNKKELPKARQMLIERTKLLEQAGCTINGIVCNTVHILLPELQAVTKVPLLSIPSLVTEQAQTAGFRRVGLLATPTTLSSTLYDEVLAGIAEVVRPDIDFAKQIEQFIYKQLNDNLLETERQKFKLQVANFNLANFNLANILDAVILGCAELPLVYGASLNDETLLDTLQILSVGLLNAYYN